MRLADRLASALLELEGVEERRSRFGPEVAFFTGDREFLHLHGDREADVRLGRAAIRRQRERLAQRRGVRLRVNRASDWVVVALERSEDVDFVIQLAATALAERVPRP